LAPPRQKVNSAGGNGNDVALFTAGIPGDYNQNGIVDIADYAFWSYNLGTSFNFGGNGNETGASAGTVDEADYAWWKQHYGNTPPGAGGLAVASSANVPEPASLALLVTMATVGLVYQRRR
jgi:hypothetical protein